MDWIGRLMPWATVALLSIPLRAQPVLTPVFANHGFQNPVDLQHAGDGSGRLFVVEQDGRIVAIQLDNEALAPQVFLDIRDRVGSRGGEEGLLGLAFHPDYAVNGMFYVHYTAYNPRRSVIARYMVDSGQPSLAQPGSEQVILEVEQPFSNHNAGQLAFGPDGYLYIGFGDGGSGGDPVEAAEDPTTLLGTVLRINVDQAEPYTIPSDNPFVGNLEGAREEIWAYGLRNPWRFSFDAVTGQLWLADVGQNAYEEVNIIERGGNYGWDHREGPGCFEPQTGCLKDGFVAPRYSYPHTEGRSITGGHVYRGTRVPEMAGRYVFADYVTGRIWSIDADEATNNATLFDQRIFSISTFGVDEQGTIYAARLRGQLYRLDSASGVGAETEQPTSTVRLSAPYPNPFTGRTTLNLESTAGTELQVAVYDVLGRAVTTLWTGISDGTALSLQWDGRTADGQMAKPGLYVIRVQQEGRTVATQTATRLSR
ncbi:MAG: hypothetical protein RhofKO_05760 [Rhodothermales bacterium]